MESVAEMELSTITLQESDERLIQLVESFPNLYDKNLTAFRDMGLRELTWSEIADALNTPGIFIDRIKYKKKGDTLDRLS